MEYVRKYRIKDVYDSQTAIEVDMDENDKRFNLQTSRLEKNGQITIPWEYAEQAYKEYSFRFGTDQDLERLHARGGFGVEEIIQFLNDMTRRQEVEIERLKENYESRQQEILNLRRKLRERLFVPNVARKL